MQLFITTNIYFGEIETKKVFTVNLDKVNRESMMKAILDKLEIDLSKFIILKDELKSESVNNRNIKYWAVIDKK